MMDKEEEPEDIPTFRAIVCGCTGSGKTHLVKWIIRELPEGGLSELYVYSASAREKDWPETTPSRIRTEWDSARLRRQMRRPGHKLFVIDDFLGLIRPDDPALVHLFTAGRHTGSSVLLITQHLTGFAPSIRVNSGRIYLCRTLAVKELDILYNETATISHQKRADWYEFVEKATRKHGVLVIEMINATDDEPFRVVHPPAEMDDIFIEPAYDTDEEDAAPVKSKNRTKLKRPLPASNKKWKYRAAEAKTARRGRRPSPV